VGNWVPDRLDFEQEMKIRELLFFISLTTLVACTYSDNGDTIDRNRLTGRYVYQANNQDTIDVNSDGTYTNYTWWDGMKLINAGTWRHDSLRGRVIFEDFSFLLDSMPRGFWDTRIKTEKNEIRFIYATDIYKGYFLRMDSVDRK
jgi:hypothetical protein